MAGKQKRIRDKEAACRMRDGRRGESDIRRPGLVFSGGLCEF